MTACVKLSFINIFVSHIIKLSVEYFALNDRISHTDNRKCTCLVVNL